MAAPTAPTAPTATHHQQHRNNRQHQAEPQPPNMGKGATSHQPPPPPVDTELSPPIVSSHRLMCADGDGQVSRPAVPKCSSQSADAAVVGGGCPLADGRPTMRPASSSFSRTHYQHHNQKHNRQQRRPMPADGECWSAATATTDTTTTTAITTDASGTTIVPQQSAQLSSTIRRHPLQAVRCNQRQMSTTTSKTTVTLPDAAATAPHRHGRRRHGHHQLQHDPHHHHHHHHHQRHKGQSVFSAVENRPQPTPRPHSAGLGWLAAATLVAVCLMAAAMPAPAAGFVLDGSQQSFAQFRKWYSALNGSVEFEFKTEQPNGLVMYTDDGGTFDFFEIKLVEGAVRLRYNLGGGANIITVGRDLHDGLWHKVQIQRNDEHTSLTVDGVVQTRTSRGKEFHFGKFATNSDVFVGGMPNWYNSKLTLLALPSVIYEPRFRGAIRNLVYSDQPSGPPRRQEMRQPRDIKCGDSPCDNSELPRDKVTRGLRGNVTDACERHDPCQHGGICISTDSGPLCECRNVEYEGTYCERDKAPSEATFRGTEFLSYDLGQTGAEPIVSGQDAISLYFRTRQPNGLLFYTGHNTDYLNLALRDGGVSLTMGLANGKQEMHIKPARVRFDDHQWHKVTVHRRIQEISSITSFCRLVAVVDDVYSDHSHIAGKFTMLSSSRVYVGGAVNPRALSGARVHTNFVGCLRKVEFSADTLRLNLIDLARTGSKLIQVFGQVVYQCPSGDPQDPVTFTTRDSHLILPPWESTGKISMLGFKFRTNEQSGLIFLTTGSKPPKTDLFAVELLNGHIYIHVDLGSGAAKVRGSRRRVDDGAWHDLTVRRNGREGKVSVDGVSIDFRTPGESAHLELDGPVFLGGTGELYGGGAALPPSIWTATLRQGFVGCLRELSLSGKTVDIAAFARQQDTGAVKPSCHIQTNQCGGAATPCQNNGVCNEGWNRPLCDCSATLYTGPTCGRESATLAFNGTQHMTIWLGGTQGTRTQTEELVLRFKTSRPAGLLLLTSAESHSPDRLELSLVAGRVRASVRMGEREKNLLAGQGVLNDNNWHTIRFSRRASNLRLQVDGAAPVRAETILGRHSSMEIRSVHLGGLFHAEEEIQMTSTMANFVGQMQGFVFNGYRYIDLVKSLGTEMTALPTTSFKVTARFVASPPSAAYHASTFRSKHSYVGLAMLKAYSTVFIDFRFKTLEANGLLFYNGGRRTDYIAVELVNGHVHYIFDLGDGPITLRDKARVHMNDNRWHSCSIRRPGPKTHTLVVDDTIEVYTAPGNNMHMELEGILYVGGVFKDMYTKLPSAIASRSGFEGCLASLDLADSSPQLAEDAVVPSSLVVNGCEGPTKCSQNACANRGVCVQQWNAYACECDMTSYTGPTCYDESVAYEFGENKGMIQYTFPAGRQPDTDEDSIAIGFITLKSDAVLLRIESSTTQDYMELEIVEGNIFMVYNIGSHDLPLGEIGTKVNDNTYHIVRFQRFGGNATLQLDDYNVQTVHPQAVHFSTMFNSMANIQVGGKIARNGRSRIERAFAGVIAGLSVNRVRVLDLAAERDPHVSVRGDVQLVTGVLDRNDLQRMQQTPASSYSGILDNLIISGDGSGCRGDDEDECTPPFESGSGDDLITPVYVPPTKQPAGAAGRKPGTTGTDKTVTAGGAATGTERTCDDEDCAHGSGDSAEGTESITSSTARGGGSGDTTVDHSTVAMGGTADNTRHTDGGTSTTALITDLETIGTTTSDMSTITGSTSPGTSSTGSAGTSTTNAGSSSTGGTFTTSTGTTTSYRLPTSIGTTTTITTTVTDTSTTDQRTTGSTSAGTTWTATTQHRTNTVDHSTATSGEDSEAEAEGNDHDRYTYAHTPSIPSSGSTDDLDHDDHENELDAPPAPGKHGRPTEHTTELPLPAPPFYAPQPPAYAPPQQRPPKGTNNKGRISSEVEERTAMIIGIIAGVLIAVILVILLMLWLKSTSDRPYKDPLDKSGVYGGQGPNAALLGGGGGSNTGTASSQMHHHQQQQQQQQLQQQQQQQPHHQQQQQQQHMHQQQQHGGGYGTHQQTNGATVNGSTGSMRNGSGGGGGDKGGVSMGGMGGGVGGGAGGMQLQKPKKRDSKDIKEWYV